ncbi:MAG: fructose-bisphosphate aldolase class I [Candidatus Marinimicrobia bacterium]|jgi:fructose-bisphosphate aldolase class I|nr:fructose-bisphosphate aldolase class I [Candidatus Neomarinimicrobiota bacterium]MBT3946096.1 fructose-bisphosphate aldolase class I [Candidatus Neomarinimicrobiota bacterium]MBT4154079.1 fructose-bisphosphate aldolase class I [Candidatus Neomarinimicrobiota bacterium]MBT4554808.1 fructose-bisphosphate aldolase class I [Candidatus Neomarinimicrobiota bacterium]MBT4752194.1 fructose-bisphosphate aldolase class I [Candidatus Neomarinimicrobiota bacterium]
MSWNSLPEIANAMVEKGRGILAADESTPTCTKRFDSIGVDSTEANRNAYRNMLFTTPGMEEFISGVILFDETLRQSTVKDGTLYPEYLRNLNVIPGIKVDKGAHNLSGTEGEKVTEGLDGLDARLKEYYELGARFAKWRAVITINEAEPSSTCVAANAHALARYAALCQENGIVPIVEPEILMDGSHTIEDSYVVTEEVLHSVFYELYAQNVLLEGMILKPNMVLSGYECSEQAPVDEVADMTVTVLKRCVPSAVPGIAFLSGGQSNENATAHLNAMNQILGSNSPWNLTYSYGRALQSSALDAWCGKEENVSTAQDAFYKRAKLNSLASKGDYSSDME